MKFSVITPTKNSLEKLRRCTGAVRGQCEADVEHLIQDARSTDGTPQWLSRQKDLLWVSEHDNGMYDAINRGWSRADGNVLCWLNSDEQYLPGSLKKVSDFFDQHPEVDFVYGNAIVVHEDGKPMAARREIRLSRTYIANSFLNASSCTTFYRRRLWDEGILKLDDRYKYASDMDLILRLLYADKRFAKLPHYLGLFTLDGYNLSCHPEMLEETAEIQRRFGGHKSSLLRRLTTLGRYFERLIKGSYRRMDLKYDFALDEVPHYRTIYGCSISGSYRTR